LLFVIEPMEAKALLPELGGSACVWTVSLVFYQTTLLAGYVYAHLLVRSLSLPRSATVHAGIVGGSALFLPWFGPTLLAQGHLPPSLWLLATLGESIGPSFFALAATGPLLQRWSAALGAVRSPYHLYALANGGSLVALLAYPALLEQYVPLTATPSDLRSVAAAFAQHSIWSSAYLVFALLVFACGWPVVRGAGAESLAACSPQPATSLRERTVWVGLAALPSAAMLSTTQVLATDIASVPLLWVVTLAIYLLTLIVAFAVPGRRISRVAGWASIALSLAIAASQWVAPRPDPAWALPLYLAALLAIGTLCHGRLAERRPAAGAVTDFYLWMAAGSAAGSIACGFIAPLVFRSIAEYPVVLALACLVGCTTATRGGPDADRWRSLARHLAWPAAVALSYSIIAIRNVRASDDRLEARTFFGVLRVRDTWGPAFIPQGGPRRGQQVRLPLRELYHGTTLHGAQVTRAAQARLPTTYYHPSGPVGRVFAALRAGEREALLAHVGIIGLGVGAIAAYAKPGETFEFFEIDPEVVLIARDSTLFSFLKDCEGTTEIEVGDGRVSLASQPDGSFGLLIVDAFSSDAVPVHLLTREAIGMDLRKIKADGLVAFHLTSNFFDLVPVVAEVAASLGALGVSWDDKELSTTDVVTGKQPSLWVVLARDPDALAPVAKTGPWVPLASQRRTNAGRWLWTDSYSSTLAALRPPRTPAIRVSGR
jgi:hypothetical protein